VVDEHNNHPAGLIGGRDPRQLVQAELENEARQKALTKAMAPFLAPLHARIQVLAAKGRALAHDLETERQLRRELEAFLGDDSLDQEDLFPRLEAIQQDRDRLWITTSAPRRPLTFNGDGTPQMDVLGEPLVGAAQEVDEVARTATVTIMVLTDHPLAYLTGESFEGNGKNALGDALRKASARVQEELDRLQGEQANAPSM